MWVYFLCDFHSNADLTQTTGRGLSFLFLFFLSLSVPDALFVSTWDEQARSKMMLVLLLFLEKGKACRTCKSFMQHYVLSVLWFSIACLDLVAGLHTLTGPSEVKQCAGRSVHIVCHYHSFYRDHVKYWCKGYYFNYCTILIRTSQSQNIYEPLQITDNKSNGFFTIHMKNAKAEDGGWYWCAIERISRHKSVSIQLFISAGKLTFLWWSIRRSFFFNQLLESMIILTYCLVENEFRNMFYLTNFRNMF